MDWQPWTVAFNKWCIEERGAGRVITARKADAFRGGWNAGVRAAAAEVKRQQRETLDQTMVEYRRLKAEHEPSFNQGLK